MEDKVKVLNELKCQKNELKNLSEVTSAYLGRMVGYCSRHKMNPLEFRQTLKAYYDFDPYENWRDRIVTVKDYPEGTGVIKAVKEVHGLYIPGVEFDHPMYGGHDLSLFTEGETHGLEGPGKPGYCLWVPLENLTFIYPEH